MNFIQRLRAMRESAEALCEINGTVGRYGPHLQVQAIIFLASPHKGLDTAALMSLVESKPTEDMIRELKAESPTLTELNERFGSVAENIDIVTCYEMKPTKTAMEIAKLKRGQGGPYPDIKVAIRKAMLSVGDLYHEADGRRTPKSQAHEPGRSLDGQDRRKKRPSMHLEARSDRPVEGQMKLQGEEMVDQEDDGNPEEPQWRSTKNQNIASKRTEPSTKRTEYDGQLKDAIKGGDVEETKSLLAKHYDVNCKDEDGRSPLHDAALSRNEPLVKLLLEKGAHPRAKTNIGTTSLHEINEEEAAQMPLTETLIDLLLQNRPPLEEADYKRRTPLMYAARRGELSMATKLITCGASTQIKDKIGRTALHHAAIRVTEPDMITLMIKEGALIDAKDRDMRTPLHYAAHNRADPVKVVKCLLQAGADPKARSTLGWTPLHLAASDADTVKVVECLLQAGADIEARTTSGWTPLHIAASNADTVKVVECLLQAGADIEARTTSGWTPLHFAAYKPAGPVKVVECLLQAGADIAARAQDRCTPLHSAAESGNPSCIGLLMRFGAEIEAVDNWMYTSLHGAVTLGKLSSVKTLLDHGADPLARDKDRLIPRKSPTRSEVTEEVKQEIDEMLREAEKAWKRSGKKSSR
ncbi:MAG: hypothetical protein LQ348_004607 [Seirophora lacunosa]|nr:MAG: hypothetical protein LQ348_004607 [Seirophora lacunosa]